MPFKFNQQTKKFEQKGNKRAYSISAGLNGQAVIRGSDFKLYGWIDAEHKWLSLGDAQVNIVASGKGDRLYKVEPNGDTLFQQVANPIVEKCQDKRQMVC